MRYMIIDIEKMKLYPYNNGDELIKQLESKTEVKSFPKPKGRPKSTIFRDWVDEGSLANCISGLHQRYFNPTCKVIEVDSETYGETDFMLCVYCALVKLGLAPSVIHNQVNKQYYRFLTDVCRIELTEKERTYNNHLNKVIRTGCDLHLLTEDIVIKKQSAGGMRPEELPVWKRMLDVTETLLLMNGYVFSLAKK